MTEKPVSEKDVDDALQRLAALARQAGAGKVGPGLKTSEMQLSTAIGSALLFAEQIGLELTDVQVVAIAAVAAVYALCRTAAKIAAIWKG